jgi:hypothetical protein
VFSPKLKLPKRSLMFKKNLSMGNSSSDGIVLLVVVLERSPKTRSSLAHTGLQDAGFRRPTVPFFDARQKTG